LGRFSSPRLKPAEVNLRVLQSDQGCEIIIEKSMAETDCEAQLYDLNGRLQCSRTLVSATTEISIAALPAGIYVLRCGNQQFKIVRP
jgi:hypothetical protein